MSGDVVRYNLFMPRKDKRDRSEYHKIYYATYRFSRLEHIRSIQNEYQKNRKKTDLRFKLDSSLSTHICTALRQRKHNRGWEKVVGFTLKDLMSHLEKKFTYQMNWDNYGEWEIDHIKPKTAFKYNDVHDSQFLECWNLDNLQPLLKSENRRKHALTNYAVLQ